MPATQLGKEAALDALRKRRETNKDRPRTDNGKLMAGSPMFFDCITCGEEFSVPEDYVTRPYLCVECTALQKAGWLED